MGLGPDDPLEREVPEGPVEDLGEGGRDELVDEGLREGEARLPGSVDYAIEDALEDPAPVQEVRYVQLQIPDRLHLDFDAHPQARLPRDRCRLH